MPVSTFLCVHASKMTEVGQRAPCIVGDMLI